MASSHFYWLIELILIDGTDKIKDHKRINMREALEPCCEFIHQAQRERGAAALYLRSQGSVYADELEEQFAEVDRRAQRLTIPARAPIGLAEGFNRALDLLPSKRKYILGQMTSPAEAITYYTQELIAPALDLASEMAVLDPRNDPARVGAFVHFLKWKERVGLERAIGAQLVSYRDCIDDEALRRLRYLLDEQHAYERIFLSLADEQCKQKLSVLKAGSEAYATISRIDHALSSGQILEEMRSFTPISWFELFSAKMDLLHELSLTLIDQMAADTSRPVPVLPRPSSMETALKERFEDIRVLPLFVGVSEDSLKALLHYARIVRHPKGALLFVQGEQATRYYIVLEGWVKLYKGSESGDESVLQVVGEGESLLETVLFTPSIYPVSAHAVDKVTLLSIPAESVREQVRESQELAVSMLSAVAGRSQRLISQFEQLTLKSVTQRIGWFLLRLFLESGERVDRMKLPYDKSLIAASLGMKPETFSRALQALKDVGIDIDRNEITLPDIHALCDYCDQELAVRCSRQSSPECPNPLMD